MSEHKITATSRNDQGKGASRRLRRSGQVPAIVYGGDAEPVAIQIERNHLKHIADNEWFYASVIELSVDGKPNKVLLRDLQRHPVKAEIWHADFMRVDDSHAIRVAVPLHFLNQETSPAGKSASVVVSHEMNEVLVSCLPKDLPEFIELDIGNLELGDIVHMSDLKLPKGVEIPELKLGKEHDHAVVTAKRARVEAEEPTDAPADPAQPPASQVDDEKKED